MNGFGLLAIFLLSCLALTNAWGLFPKPKIAKALVTKKLIEKSLVAAGAGVAVVGATAAGAVVAATIVQNNRPDPYEPSPGSMDGKLVLITGGSSGLGLESAKRLAKAGATIVLTSRNASKGLKAIEKVQSSLPDAKIFNLELDLDDLESVRAFASSFEALELGPIDVLLNNAGVMAIPDRQLTVDGNERTFQSNHLGHFLLTAQLLPFLNRDQTTIINVSSMAYAIASKNGLEMDNLNGEKQYGAWSSYGQSKLANILFTQELQRRADAAGDDWLTAVTLHPGAVSTDLGRYLIGEERWKKMKEESDGVEVVSKLIEKGLSLVTKTVEDGASTHVYLASGAEGKLEKAAYYDDLKVKSLPSYAKDEVKAKLLWEKSEELTGITFEFESDETSDALEEEEPEGTVTEESEDVTVEAEEQEEEEESDEDGDDETSS